jgi:hypothetical protein
MTQEILNELHGAISELENAGMIKEADVLTDVFIKVAAKKKKKKSAGKNVPNNPSLWSSCKSQAKAKFDVYPSAYANGWAAKQYKAKGGTWKKG